MPKKVADYFLDNMENVFNLPIAQLAQEAGVSKVAWMRFCKDIVDAPGTMVHFPHCR